ncbi:MAG: glycosyltransferase [Candidatus Tectomicrobia bacterium]|nr:glycosyltransferase [Candidatus Tectomicrobia bacterium]
MASALASHGVEVGVATTTADGRRELDVPLDRPVVEDRVRYFYFRRQRPKSWTFSWPLTRWLDANIGRYDVVHVHALFSYPTLPACRLARKHRVPYVLRPLGTLDEWSLRRRRWKKAPYFCLVERPNLLRAAAIHVTSEKEAEDVRRLGLPVRTLMIPLGVNVDPPPARPHRSSPPGDGVTVLFLGRLHPKKGIELLLDAAARLVRRHPLRIILAGEGAPRYVRGLRRRVRELGLDPVVTFPGFVNGAGKRELLSAADLFVLPSLDENFGLSVVEAMAAGLPVIVSDKVGVAKEIQRAGAGRVIPCETVALETTLDGLARDPVERETLGRNAARLARDKFSWDTVVPQLIAAYREIAGERQEARPG